MASAECSEDCNRLVFEAVNESSITKFKLVKQTFSEIEVLTSLIQCNEKGETPLEIAMKGENVSLIDELVIFLKLCDRKIAKCNVMSEAIDKLFCRPMPILELIDYVINIDSGFLNFGMVNNTEPNTEWSDIIAQVVFKSTFLSRPDKIIALELIGASLFKYYEESSKSFAVMFRCWREAMTLRFFPADGEPLLPKIPYVGVPSVASSVVFESAVEVMTIEELDLLQEDFERNVVAHSVEGFLRWISLLSRQSLLVIRRISSQANHGHPHWLYLQSLYEIGSGDIQDDEDDDGHLVLYVEDGADNQLIVNTFLLILEQITELDPKLLPRKSFDIFIKTLSIFSHYLALMAMKPPGYQGREELFSYTNLLALTKFIGTIPKFFPNPAMISTIKFYYRCYSDLAEILYDLVYVLESMSPHLNNRERQQLEEYFTNYIRNLFPERTTHVLHAGVRCLLKRKFRTSYNLKSSPSS